jgi:hypothetical protein
MSETDKNDAVKSESEDEKNESVIRLSKNQLKTLGLEYKRPQSEKEKIRNEMLRQKAIERHAKARQLKAEKEAEAVERLKSKFAIKPKQKYNNKVEVAIDNSDEEDYNEFQKFKEMKKQKKLEPKSKPEKKEESDDDGFIQNKQKKAVAVIETINKLDTAINKINSNPYLAIFNQKL